MKEQHKNSVEIRNFSKGEKNTPAVECVDEWREKFKLLLQEFPNNLTLYRELSKIDHYYGTVSGDYELRNVRKGVAGIRKTARAVQTLEKWFEQNGSKKKRLKRQKLVLPDQ